jgi:hypothetical protein
MKAIKSVLTAILSLVLSIGCSSSQKNIEESNSSPLFEPPLSEFICEESGWKISLFERREGAHLEYIVTNVKSSKLLILKSSRYKTDGYELKVGKGRGIVVHARNDGNAILINEWQDCANQEGKMIFIALDNNNNPIHLPYDLRNNSILDSSDVGSELLEKFVGWNHNGKPIVDVVN